MTQGENKSGRSIVSVIMVAVFIIAGYYLFDWGEAGSQTGSQVETQTTESYSTGREEPIVSFGQDYYDMADVADYLHVFEELPPNYVTKAEADAAGWIPSEGNLWEVLDGAVIGGDGFGNREGLLPEESGRRYYEADVNYRGGRRGAERLVYSNDGLIFYTEDHYESFERVY